MKKSLMSILIGTFIIILLCIVCGCDLDSPSDEYTGDPTDPPKSLTWEQKFKTRIEKDWITYEYSYRHDNLVLSFSGTNCTKNDDNLTYNFALEVTTNEYEDGRNMQFDGITAWAPLDAVYQETLFDITNLVIQDLCVDKGYLYNKAACTTAAEYINYGPINNTYYYYMLFSIGLDQNLLKKSNSNSKVISP